MKHFKSCVCFMALFLLLFVGVNNVKAAISNSPHDVMGWGASSTGLFEKAGICAFCHIPHSAKGERLFPQAIDSADAYGKIAAICWKCHGNNVYLGKDEPKLLNEIYITLDTNHTAAKGEQDSHPVTKTAVGSQGNTLQNTNINDTLAWPWAAGWGYAVNGSKATATADIECTTCHNPHDWNSDAWGVTGKRKFLRKPLYETAGNSGRGKSFCEYCHINRDSDTANNALGTHPVGRQARYSDCTTSTGGGVGTTVVINWRMIKYLADSTVLDVTTERWGHGCWDTAATNVWIGSRLGPNHSTGAPDVVICQSCHMPHGVAHSEDDVYMDSATNQLRVGPLLAVNNATSVPDTSNSYIPEYAIGNYPFPTETAWTLASGQEENLLCEWCHGMTPDLNSTTNALNAFAHPVNLMPTPTDDNQPSDSTEYGIMDIVYPPAGWLKYRESGGIRGVTSNPTHSPNGDRSASSGNEKRFLVCLSCHEAHQAEPGTPLLKKGMAAGGSLDSATFCDGCHDNAALGVGTDTALWSDWTTHPSGKAATLVTKDASGRKLPNKRGLKTFGTGTGEYISCWTCHKAHKGVEKPLLADYQTQYSQICVNCHCTNDSTNTFTQAQSKDGLYMYGTAGAGYMDGNPSWYYLEGAWPNWWESVFAQNPAGRRGGKYAMGNAMRLGSHYIGQFTGTRPALDTATGWLGERSVNRQGSTNPLNTLDHRVQAGTTDVDLWLDTLWTDTAFGFKWPQSLQFSHVGKNGSALVISCQACHTAHRSAVGVADDSTFSRLLLGPNVDSYMCKRCHIPDYGGGKTHAQHIDAVGDVYGSTKFVYNTLLLDQTSRTNRLVSVTGSNYYAYNFNSTVAPANYPTGKRGAVAAGDSTLGRMNCDACHSAHNADSKMGAMIVEGDGGGTISNYPAGFNKVPTISERGYVEGTGTTRTGNRDRTCNLCHGQFSGRSQQD